MTDLLSAVNCHDQDHSKGWVQWAARNLGETFRKINNKDDFFCYAEDDSAPTTLEARARTEGTEELFTKEGLYVPREWAEKVLRLARAGVTEIKWLWLALN